MLTVGGTFISIDTILRGWFARFLLNVTIILGIITATILGLDFWRFIVPLGLLILVINITRENLRELWSP